MSNLHPYLIFAGNCEEAVKFYCEVFAGEIQFSTTFKEGPVDVPANWKNKIMHTSFTLRGETLMASDSFPGLELVAGNNIVLSVKFEKGAKMEEMFLQLAQEGKISMPLQTTFWGACFGQLTDRFGVNWMFSQELPKEKE